LPKAAVQMRPAVGEHADGTKHEPSYAIPCTIINHSALITDEALIMA
jgi:hypothetical protein